MSSHGIYPLYPPVTPPNHMMPASSPAPSISSYPSMSSTPIFPSSSSKPLHPPSTTDRTFIHTIYAPNPTRSPPPSHAHPPVPQLLSSFSNAPYTPQYVPPVPPCTPPYVPLHMRRPTNLWPHGGFGPMPLLRIQPMWMDLSVGALASMPDVHKHGDGFRGIMERTGIAEMTEMSEKDGEGVGVGDTGVRLSGREVWRCKNHWNGVFCPKWVLNDGAACGACMGYGYY